MRLGIIPARGGSKRIPRKNIKIFCGKPMIAWSIIAAQATGLFDKLIVSTDDVEIARIASDFGAEVPFERPKDLSCDKTDTASVIRHAINWYTMCGIKFTNVCCIYATAPFITSRDIKLAEEKISQVEADFVFPVTSFAYPIQRALMLNDDGTPKMFDPTQFDKRSQDLEEAFHDAGQFYWGSTDAWLSGKPIFNTKCATIYLPRNRVIDIDTYEDWSFAEAMFKANQFESIGVV